MDLNGYVVVQSWMRTELELKGTELMAYAVVYGFSQDGESWFTGSAAYIAEWCGVTKKSARDALARLTERGLLEKRVKDVGGVRLCDYRALPYRGKNFPGVGKNLPQGREDFTPGGREDFTPHNLEIDNLGDTLEEREGTRARKKPEKMKLGEYANVLMTADEVGKLKAEFPADWERRVDRLSEYMASTGKTYKSHLATIRAWARKDREKSQPVEKPVDYSKTLYTKEQIEDMRAWEKEMWG